MVGFYRYILAALVLYSHLNFPLWDIFGVKVNQGVFAVFSFYIISGFFSAVIFERFKSGESYNVPRFYEDRLLRLLPLFWAVVLLVVCINLISFEPALGATLGDYRTLSSYVYAALQPLNGLLCYLFGGDFPFGPFFHFTPVASLALEVQFMLILPWIALLSNRFLLSIIGLATMLTARALTSGDSALLENYTYRYIIGLLPLFLIGLMLYRQIHQKVPAWARCELLGLLLGLAYFTALATGTYRSTSMLGEFALALITCPFILRWCLTKRTGGWDHLAGYLSYGIFLTHIPILRFLHLPQQSHLSFAIALTLSTMIASALHFTLERPILRMRHRIALQEVKTISLK